MYSETEAMEELRKDIDWKNITIEELKDLYREYAYSKSRKTEIQVNNREDWLKLNTKLPDPYQCGVSHRLRYSHHLGKTKENGILVDHDFVQMPFINKRHVISCTECKRILSFQFPRLFLDLNLKTTNKPKGSVGVEVFQNRLRIRLPRQIYGGKQKYVCSGLLDVPENRKKVEKVGKVIEKDLNNQDFDNTLTRYKEMFVKIYDLDNLIKFPTLKKENGKTWIDYLETLPYEEVNQANFSGIYIITANINNEETPIYVGKSLNISQRWKGKTHHRNAEIDFLIRLGIRVEVKILPLPSNDNILLEVERSLIAELQPRLNGTKVTNLSLEG